MREGLGLRVWDFGAVDTREACEGFGFILRGLGLMVQVGFRV